jgi:O-Antigen ligase
MPTPHLLLLMALLLADIQATRYVGGLATGTLLGIYLCMLVAGASLNLVRYASRNSDGTLVSDGLARQPINRWQRAFLLTLLAYGVALAIATAISPMPALMAEEALALGLLPIGYCVTRAALRFGVHWAQIWIVFKTVTVALALFALAERLLTGTRAYTVLADPNALAGLFNVFVLTQFSSVVAQWRRHAGVAPSAIALLLLFSAATGATGSLSGLLCLGAVLVPFTLVSARQQARQQKIRTWGAACAVALAAITCSSAKNQEQTPTEKLQEIAHHSSFTVRVELVRSSLAIYRDSPWYGSGLGTFKLFYPRYRSPLDSGTTGDLVHNDYVQFLQEGGPLLAGSLLLTGLLVLVRTIKMVRSGWRQGFDPEILVQIGLGAALLTLLLQAGMNFIFYLAPLALLFGVLLAGFCPVPQKATHPPPPPSPGQAGIYVTVVIALALCLLSTLGARALFLSLSQQSCSLHGCLALQSNVRFMQQLTAYLAGTQPTWFPAREYLYRKDVEAERAATDPAEQARWRNRAFYEASSLVQTAPQVSGMYVMLADTLSRDPGLASQLPAGLPQAAVELYQLALAHDPLDLPLRLKIADLLRDAGKVDQAYSVLQVVTPFWYYNGWGDGGRMRLLTASLPLAVSLKKCEDAKEMSVGLSVFMQIQKEAQQKGEPLPAPPNTLPPPSLEESEKVQALASNCHSERSAP